jgi:hypothetical protein
VATVPSGPNWAPLPHYTNLKKKTPLLIRLHDVVLNEAHRLVFTIPVNSTEAGRGRELASFVGNRCLRSALDWKLKQAEETGAIESPLVEMVLPWQTPFCW